MQYTVVDEDEAKGIKQGVDYPQWKTDLLAGKMLKAVSRPNWTKADTEKSGYRMRSKQSGEEFFVWLEQVPGVHGQTELDPVELMAETA